MRPFIAALALALLVPLGTAKQWPYDRYHAVPHKSGHQVADRSRPEHDTAPTNEFIHWLRLLSQKDEYTFDGYFVNNTLPRTHTFEELFEHLQLPTSYSGREFENRSGSVDPPHVPRPWPSKDAEELFKHLGFPLDPSCTSDGTKWWFRTYGGECNWMKVGESDVGQYGTAKSRDYDQHFYADGISTPREGPNPRAVSNAFFKRKKSLYYEHTPLLLGLVEFIIHDISWSQDSSTEFIDVPVPDDEEDFKKGTTFRVWRTEPAPGTGTSKSKPRENLNRATTWLDLSSLYGSTQDVALKLRSFKGGKLLTQEVQARGTKKMASYLPFNTMGVPTRTRPGVDVKSLFAGGDPRTNEDWIMLSVHNLLLREHNRMCDLLAAKQPGYDDENLYQTVRLLMSAKFELIGNAYQMAYFKDMPWPMDDGFPLYREMKGENWLQINPANTYPWPLATHDGKPTTVSAEMAVVYRFHEFIINNFPIKDALNQTIWEQSLFDTGFNSSGYLDAGLDNILRGVVSTSIPNFKSGVDDSFRSAGKYQGHPFDIVTWSIVHEREQGLPPFNAYFRAYNAQGPQVKVPIREKFEDFSSDPEMVAHLQRLYKSPEDVDLVVGCQLDESLFPHASIPTSSLVISLFSLISMGNSDRFSIGFAAMRCWLVDKPWDCHPSNALEELLWKPVVNSSTSLDLTSFRDVRFYDSYWMAELDFQAHGQNLLWRMVTENTEIKCLQRNPLFPMDPETNPLLCALPKQGVDISVVASSFLEIFLSLIRLNKAAVLVTLGAALAVYLAWKKAHEAGLGYPRVMQGWPVVGKALDFQKDAKSLLLQGFQKYASHGPSKTFGLRLGSLTHYVLSQPEDLQMMLDDNPYEMKFNSSKFFEAINTPIILRKNNVASNIHTNLIRTHLGDPKTVQSLGKTIEMASRRFLETEPLVPSGSSSQRHETLGGYLDHFITSVSVRAMVGPEADDHPELIDMFLAFNTQVDKIMGLGTMLPSAFNFISKWSMDKSYNKFRDIFKPIIKRRRAAVQKNSNGHDKQDESLDFMPFILAIIDDDDRASDLVTISVWFGLRNLQITVRSTILDIINVPGLDNTIASSLRGATTTDLSTFGTNPGKDTPWALLRSSMFESIRLCGSITGPARIVASAQPLALKSDKSVHLPVGQVATLSSYYSHRMPENYGPTAASFQADRFVHVDPDVGSVSWITWGLKGPHTCPGRWYAQEAICVMVKAMLVKYEFEAEVTMRDEDKYVYHAGVVTRKEVPVIVRLRRGA